MFVLSQYLLNKFSHLPHNLQITYSVSIGMILYTSLYLYILYYHGEYLDVFHKFLIYIIMIDLVLSILYGYIFKQNKEEYDENDDIEDYNRNHINYIKENLDKLDDDDYNEDDDDDDDIDLELLGPKLDWEEQTQEEQEQTQEQEQEQTQEQTQEQEQEEPVGIDQFINDSINFDDISPLPVKKSRKTKG